MKNKGLLSKEIEKLQENDIDELDTIGFSTKFEFKEIARVNLIFSINIEDDTEELTSEIYLAKDDKLMFRQTLINNKDTFIEDFTCQFIYKIHNIIEYEMTVLNKKSKENEDRLQAFLDLITTFIPRILGDLRENI